MEEPMDDDYTETLLDAYYCDRMTPAERKVFCEQEHLIEFQGIPLYQTYGHPMDDNQRSAIRQQQELEHDQNQQITRIYELQAADYRVECHNQNLLDDKERWES